MKRDGRRDITDRCVCHLLVASNPRTPLLTARLNRFTPQVTPGALPRHVISLCSRRHRRRGRGPGHTQAPHQNGQLIPVTDSDQESADRQGQYERRSSNPDARFQAWTMAGRPLRRRRRKKKKKGRRCLERGDADVISDPPKFAERAAPRWLLFLSTNSIRSFSLEQSE